MKRTLTFQIMLFLVAIGLASFIAGNEPTKIHLKVTKNENGKTSVLEKTYANMEALKSDEELKKFDVLLEKWTKDAGEHKIMFKNQASDGDVLIMKKPRGESMTWVNENGDSVMTQKEIIIKTRDGKEEKIISNKKEVIIISDEEGGTKTWTDEKGNVMKLRSNGVDDKDVVVFDSAGTKKIIITKKLGDNEMTWTDDNGNVLKSNPGSAEKKVMVFSDESGDSKEITIDVKAETDEDGKTITKQVWITKDGEKTEIDSDDKMEIITSGDTFKIKMDPLEGGEFAMGKGKKKVMMIKEFGDESDAGETMDVEIENKNGEQFIDIHINRSAAASVTISDATTEDASLKGSTVAIKNNLKAIGLSYTPNPSTGKFTLKFALDKNDPVTISVLDIQGNEVYKETVLDFKGIYDNQINLKGKAEGIYLLQVAQSKKSLTKKIVIE